MGLDEANEIFKGWQGYLEIADKMNKLMLSLPPSCLPYPVEVLEEALNLVAKDCFDAGDIETSEMIQRLMTIHLFRYYLPEQGRIMSDAEALEDMRKRLDLILENDDLKRTVLANLKEAQRSWIDARRSE